MTTVLTWVCREGQVHCGPVLQGFSLPPHVLEDEAQPLLCPSPITIQSRLHSYDTKTSDSLQDKLTTIYFILLQI